MTGRKMTGLGTFLLLLLMSPLMLLAACSSETEPLPAEDAAPSTIPPTITQAMPQAGSLPLQASDFPALENRDCNQIVHFYTDAIASGDFARAALVWSDPVIDAARLEALFSDYAEPHFTFDAPEEEGAAGSLYCTINGELNDNGSSEKTIQQGTIILRRVNDVPGATAKQLRWTIQSSTFIEPMERSRHGTE